MVTHLVEIPLLQLQPSPVKGEKKVKASLEQRRPQAKGILFPKAEGMSAVLGHGVKLSGLPVTRRALPKPTRTTASLGMNTLANSMLVVSRDGSKYVDVWL